MALNKKAIAKAIGEGLTDDQVRERLRAMDRFLKASDFGLWDCVIPLGPQADGRYLGIHGGFEDWPRQVQDQIMYALVRDCECRPGYSVKIIASGCVQDVKDEPAYLRVIAQEVPDMGVTH